MSRGYTPKERPESSPDVRAGAADGTLAVTIGHVFADQRGHAPCRLVSDPKLALQFLGADTVPRGGKQVQRIEPKLERGAGFLERGANGRVQVVAAPLAGIGPLGFDPEPLGRAVARRASEALPEPHVKQVLQAGFVVRILAEEGGGGEGLRVHARSYAPTDYVCQGDTPPKFGMDNFNGR